jgi:hypothetical protein
MAYTQLDRVCAEYEIEAEAEAIGERTDGSNGNWTHGSSHWRVTLRGWDRELTVEFSQGPAICREPTAADVLYCLCSDTVGLDCTDGFHDWCANYGYDAERDDYADDRETPAERTYRLVNAQAVTTREFLDIHFDEFARAEH